MIHDMTSQGRNVNLIFIILVSESLTFAKNDYAYYRSETPTIAPFTELTMNTTQLMQTLQSTRTKLNCADLTNWDENFKNQQTEFPILDVIEYHRRIKRCGELERQNRILMEYHTKTRKAHSTVQLTTESIDLEEIRGDMAREVYVTERQQQFNINHTSKGHRHNHNHLSKNDKSSKPPGILKQVRDIMEGGPLKDSAANTDYIDPTNKGDGSENDLVMKGNPILHQSTSVPFQKSLITIDPQSKIPEPINLHTKLLELLKSTNSNPIRENFQTTKPVMRTHPGDHVSQIVQESSATSITTAKFPSTQISDDHSTKKSINSSTTPNPIIKVSHNKKLQPTRRKQFSSIHPETEQSMTKITENQNSSKNSISMTATPSVNLHEKTTSMQTSKSKNHLNTVTNPSVSSHGNENPKNTASKNSNDQISNYETTNLPSSTRSSSIPLATNVAQQLSKNGEHLSLSTRRHTSSDFTTDTVKVDFPFHSHNSKNPQHFSHNDYTFKEQIYPRANEMTSTSTQKSSLEPISSTSRFLVKTEHSPSTPKIQHVSTLIHHSTSISTKSPFRSEIPEVQELQSLYILSKLNGKHLTEKPSMRTETSQDTTGTSLPIIDHNSGIKTSSDFPILITSHNNHLKPLRNNIHEFPETHVTPFVERSESEDMTFIQPQDAISQSASESSVPNNRLSLPHSSTLLKMIHTTPNSLQTKSHAVQIKNLTTILEQIIELENEQKKEIFGIRKNFIENLLGSKTDDFTNNLSTAPLPSRQELIEDRILEETFSPLPLLQNSKHQTTHFHDQQFKKHDHSNFGKKNKISQSDTNSENIFTTTEASDFFNNEPKSSDDNDELLGKPRLPKPPLNPNENWKFAKTLDDFYNKQRLSTTQKPKKIRILPSTTTESTRRTTKLHTTVRPSPSTTTESTKRTTKLYTTLRPTIRTTKSTTPSKEPKSPAQKPSTQNRTINSNITRNYNITINMAIPDVSRSPETNEGKHREPQPTYNSAEPRDQYSNDFTGTSHSPYIPPMNVNPTIPLYNPYPIPYPAMPLNSFPLVFPPYQSPPYFQPPPYGINDYLPEQPIILQNNDAMLASPYLPVDKPSEIVNSQFEDPAVPVHSQYENLLESPSSLESNTESDITTVTSQSEIPITDVPEQTLIPNNSTTDGFVQAEFSTISFTEPAAVNLPIIKPGLTLNDQLNSTILVSPCQENNCTQRECNNIYVIPNRSVDVMEILRRLLKTFPSVNTSASPQSENQAILTSPHLSNTSRSSNNIEILKSIPNSSLSEIKTMLQSIHTSFANGATPDQLQQSINELLTVLKQRRNLEYRNLYMTRWDPVVGNDENTVVTIMQIDEYIELLELMLVYLARDPDKLLDEKKDVRISNYESPYPPDDPHRQLIEDQFYYVHPKILNEFIDVYKKYSKDDGYFGTPKWHFAQENGQRRNLHSELGKSLKQLFHLNGLISALLH